MEHQVFEHKLAGGTKGLVIHVPGSQVVNLVIAFNSGYQFGDFSKYEIPHVLEHLIGTSTTHYPKHTALKIEVQKNGAYRNAFTNAVANRYEFEFASFELDRILSLLEEHFLETQLPEKIVQTEIGNVRQELTGNTAQPARVCFNAHAQATYPNLYISLERRLSQLADITVLDLASAFKRMYTRANMRFYLAGNFPDHGSTAVKQIDDALSQLPWGERFQPDRSPGQSYAPQAVPREIEQVHYRMNWSTKGMGLDLWPAATVLASLLGEGYGSRIHGEARHRGLAYHVDTGTGYTLDNSVLSIGGNVTPDNVKPLFTLISEQIQAVREGKATQEEIEATKNLRIGSRIRATQTAESLLDWYMGEYEEREAIEDWDGWNTRLRAVTVEQVVEVANHMTRNANHGVTFVGPVTQAQAQRFAKILEPVGK